MRGRQSLSVRYAHKTKSGKSKFRSTGVYSLTCQGHRAATRRRAWEGRRVGAKNIVIEASVLLFFPLKYIHGQEKCFEQTQRGELSSSFIYKSLSRTQRRHPRVLLIATTASHFPTTQNPGISVIGSLNCNPVVRMCSPTPPDQSLSFVRL
jgi:hypothetical protein